MVSQAGLRRRPATARRTVPRGGIQGGAREARGESCTDSLNGVQTGRQILGVESAYFHKILRHIS